MNKFVFSAIAISILSSCTNDNEVAKTKMSKSNYDISSLKQEAKTTFMKFGKALKGGMKGALKSGGGPVAGISVCSVKAPEIAKRISAENNAKVSRVSLKYRNENTGKPNEWQTKVLEKFESEKLTGKNVKEIAYAAIVEANGHKEFRMMKAIPTAKGCLKCHGSNIAKPIADILDKIYPNDKARFFKEGDIRGAFVYSKQL